MGQSIRELIFKGQRAINKYQLEGKEIPSDWNEHLTKLMNEYKTDTVRGLLDEINEYYSIGLFNWLNENNRSLYEKNIEIENKLNDNNLETREFDATVEKLKEWYKKAIPIYQDKKESKKGYICTF